MKLSAAKLKSINYKELAIAHGEKAVIGLVAVFVLYALFKTNWIPYSGTPEEMTENARVAEETISKKAWPTEMAKQYAALPDIRAQVLKVISPVENSSRFEWTSVPMFWPIIPQKEPSEEPEWETVDNLIATAGRAILIMNKGNAESVVTPQPTTGPAAEEAGDDSEIPEEFRTRTPAGGRKARGATRNRRLGQQNRATASFIGDDDDDDDDDDGGFFQRGRRRGAAGGPRRRRASNVNGLGKRFVVVRGAFPLRRQLRKIAKAMKDLSQLNEQDNVVFYDFELQRQVASRGSDDWSDWEPVDIQSALDVLTEVADFDPDVVDSRIVDDVITMPLPARGYGYWGELATHPAVEEYELPDEEERQLDSLINEIVLKERSQWETQKDKAKPTATFRGFGTQQHNPRHARRRAATVMGRDLINLVQENFNSEQRKTALLAHITTKMTAADRMVLFRYIDFDVEQSNRYKYRVKFELGNPNFGRDPSEVAYPEVALGPTRWTKLSKPTEPVLVPPDFNYFLSSVEEASSSGRRQPRAMLNIFYWHPDSGTVVNDVLSTQIGQMIGGATQAEVLDPVNEYFERQDIDMQTESALVDVRDNPKINKRLHPDLELPTLHRGRLGISPRALTVDQSGKLRSLDPVSQVEKLRRAEQRLEWERKPYDHLKNAIANAEVVNDFDGLMPGDDDDDDDDGGYRRKKSAIRKKKGRQKRWDDD